MGIPVLYQYVQYKKNVKMSAQNTYQKSNLQKSADYGY